jgi:type I restriction enzyme S subunit
MVREGTTLLGTTATIGTCAIAGCDLTFNQQISGLIPKKNTLDDRFLFYWIQFAKPIFERLAAGTSFKRISTSVLKTVEIKFPPHPVQKRIVDLISSVDSYIESLQQHLESAKRSRNAVLYELMRSTSSENIKPLIQLAKLQRGHDLPTQSRIKGSIPVVASNGVVGFHNTSKAIGPGVVTGRSGTIGKVIYIDNDYWPLNTTLYVVDFKGNVPKFVALVLETLKLENYAGGSTVPSLDRNVLSDVPVPCPNIEEQERVVEIIQTFDESIDKAGQAIDEAKNLRSGLLTDLLSGEYEIPATYDKVMGAA